MSGQGESVLMGAGTCVPTLLAARGRNWQGLKLSVSNAASGFLTKLTHH